MSWQHRRDLCIVVAVSNTGIDQSRVRSVDDVDVVVVVVFNQKRALLE